MLPNLLLPPSEDAVSARPVEAQFTCFTSTKVLVLSTCFTSTKVLVLSRIASPRRT
jgi:hypothetical protein